MEKIRKSRRKSGRKILSKLLSLLSVNSAFASLELDFSKIRNLTDIRILNFAKGWKSWEGINDRAIESDNVWITRFSELSCKKKSWKFLIRGRATFLFSFFTIYTRSLFVPAFMCRFCGFYFFPSFCHSLFPTAPCCGGYSTPRIPRTKPPVPLSYRTHCKTPTIPCIPIAFPEPPPTLHRYTSSLPSLTVCLRWILATVVLLFRINIRRFPRPRIYLTGVQIISRVS